MKPNPVLIILAIACIILATVLIATTAMLETRYYVYPADKNTAVPMPQLTQYRYDATAT